MSKNQRQFTCFLYFFRGLLEFLFHQPPPADSQLHCPPPTAPWHYRSPPIGSQFHLSPRAGHPFHLSPLQASHSSHTLHSLYKQDNRRYETDKCKRLGYFNSCAAYHQRITSESLNDESSKAITSHIYKRKLSFEFLVLSIYK